MKGIKSGKEARARELIEIIKNSMLELDSLTVDANGYVSAFILQGHFNIQAGDVKNPITKLDYWESEAVSKC